MLSDRTTGILFGFSVSCLGKSGVVGRQVGGLWVASRLAGLWPLRRWAGRRVGRQEPGLSGQAGGQVYMCVLKRSRASCWIWAGSGLWLLLWEAQFSLGMYATLFTRSRSSPAILLSMPSSGQFIAEDPLFGEFIHSLPSCAKEPRATSISKSLMGVHPASTWRSGHSSTRCEGQGVQRLDLSCIH